jgi:ubiquinone/menaquinone biosynthesis C-methylase UbiE
MEPDEVERVRGGFEAFYQQKWSGHGGFWLDWYPRYLGLYADLLRQRNRAIEAALPERMDAVLDVGCGAGDVSALLKARARTVVSFDVAQSNALQTRRNLMARFHDAVVLRAGAEELPFPSGRFDAVVLADVIEHIPRREQAVAELARVLRPGGLLVMATPDRPVLETIEKIDRVAMSFVNGLRAIARRALGRARRARPDVDAEQWEQFFTRSELAALVEGAGLRVREHRNICFYPGPEGGGTFALLLAYLSRIDGLPERVIEPVLRPLFAAVARLEFLNQKQLIVAEK